MSAAPHYNYTTLHRTAPHLLVKEEHRKRTMQNAARLLVVEGVRDVPAQGRGLCVMFWPKGSSGIWRIARRWSGEVRAEPSREGAGWNDGTLRDMDGVDSAVADGVPHLFAWPVTLSSLSSKMHSSCG